MRKNSRIHRKIWEESNGPIPLDSDGRSYEIHHVDGNPENNDISNLICVTIQEHYDIHFKQGDYGACHLIAKRMSKTPAELSKIVSDLNRLRAGELNPFYGKTHSAETKLIIGSKSKGRKNGKASESRKKMISEKIKNYNANGRSDEHIINARAAKQTEEYKNKIRKSIIAFGVEYDSIKSAKEVHGHSKIWSALKDPNNDSVRYKNG